MKYPSRKNTFYQLIKEIIFFSLHFLRQARNASCIVETSRRDVFLINTDGSPIKNVGDDKVANNPVDDGAEACGCLLPISE